MQHPQVVGVWTHMLEGWLPQPGDLPNVKFVSPLPGESQQLCTRRVFGENSTILCERTVVMLSKPVAHTRAELESLLRTRQDFLAVPAVCSVHGRAYCELSAGPLANPPAGANGAYACSRTICLPYTEICVLRLTYITRSHSVVRQQRAKEASKKAKAAASKKTFERGRLLASRLHCIYSYTAQAQSYKAHPLYVQASVYCTNTRVAITFSGGASASTSIPVLRALVRSGIKATVGVSDYTSQLCRLRASQFAVKQAAYVRKLVEKSVDVQYREKVLLAISELFGLYFATGVLRPEDAPEHEARVLEMAKYYREVSRLITKLDAEAEHKLKAPGSDVTEAEFKHAMYNFRTDIKLAIKQAIRNLPEAIDRQGPAGKAAK